MAAGADVTLAAVWFDQQFAADHPSRRYWTRPGWVVRRRSGGVFLRARLADAHQPGADTESAAEFQWWLAAWPALTPPERRKAAKRARGLKPGRAAPALPTIEGATDARLPS